LVVGAEGIGGGVTSRDEKVVRIVATIEKEADECAVTSGRATLSHGGGHQPHLGKCVDQTGDAE
jgi:hypothetical protein